MTGTEHVDKARTYFGQPAFTRMLSEVWKKYAVLERAGGQVVLERINAEESEAVNSFFGWNCRPGDTVRISLVLFERELASSAFPYTIPELHGLLTGQRLLTKSERRLLRQEEWQSLFTAVRRRGASDLPEQVSDWLSRLEQGAARGYRTLRELFKASPAGAEAALACAVRALAVVACGDPSERLGLRLPKVRMPVLAAMVSGDPHALDLKQPAGRLFVYALRELKAGPASPESDEEKEDESGGIAESLKVRELYRSAGIADDDLSSLVYVYIPQTGSLPQPTVWSLRQVEAMQRVPDLSDLYILENPSVFSTLLDLTSSLAQSAVAHPPPALVCTSGAASAAAWRLVERWSEKAGGNSCVYYSGDFDPKGLEMAVTLARYCGNRFRSWRFDASVYEEFCAKGASIRLAVDELARLRDMQVPWDDHLARKMRHIGLKLFQESIVATLADDWLNALTGRLGKKSDCV